MSAYATALAIDDGASDERLTLATEILRDGDGIVLFKGRIALRRVRSQLRCEILDPMPSTRRCAHEYEVLVENARRELQRSKLWRLLPAVPCTWTVVEDQGAASVEVWRAI
jgi:hypothetical protein